MIAAELNLADRISMIIGFLIVIGAVAFLICLFRRGKRLDQTQSSMTAPETVHVRQTDTMKGQTLGKYHYYVYFHTDDGRDLRLSVSRDEFRELTRTDQVFTPGRVYDRRPSGMLTYQGSTLISFERDPAE